MAEKKILTVKSPTIIDSYYTDEEFEKELDKISLEALASSGQMRVIQNIRKTLAVALKKKYGFSNGELKELTTKILKNDMAILTGAVTYLVISSLTIPVKLVQLTAETVVMLMDMVTEKLSMLAQTVITRVNRWKDK